MAAGVFTLKRQYTSGDRKVVVADLVLTGSYVVGGHAVAGLDLGLEVEVFDVDARYAVGSAGKVGTRYNETTGKVQLYGNSDASAAINEADPEMTAVALPGGPLTVRLVATGKGQTAIPIP